MFSAAWEVLYIIKGNIRLSYWRIPSERITSNQKSESPNIPTITYYHQRYVLKKKFTNIFWIIF